jgi:hypothetical protein
MCPGDEGVSARCAKTGLAGASDWGLAPDVLRETLARVISDPRVAAHLVINQPGRVERGGPRSSSGNTRLDRIRLHESSARGVQAREGREDLVVGREDARVGSSCHEAFVPVRGWGGEQVHRHVGEKQVHSPRPWRWLTVSSRCRPHDSASASATTSRTTTVPVCLIASRVESEARCSDKARKETWGI